MTSATPTPSPQTTILGDWQGDATVVAVEATGSGACGWGTAPGEKRAGVYWQIRINGKSIQLYEDMQNYPTDGIPYTGTLVNGRQFTAAYTQGSDYLNYACQFREAYLSGSFSADGSFFEAGETLAWGPRGADTVVQRRWTGSKIP